MKPPRRLHDPRDLLRATAAAAARDERALAACQALLLALRRADAERGGDLERTLRTYYERGASVSATATALFLHRNSVRYRLDRVRLLLGSDIDEPAVAASLITAFTVDDEAASREDEHAAQRAQ